MLKTMVVLVMTGAALPAMAASLDRMEFSNDQVRSRLKDACIYERGKTAKPEQRLAPGCACYAKTLIETMTEDEIAAWKKDGGLPRSAMPAAQAAWDKCMK